MVNEIVNGDAQKITMDVYDLPNGVYIMNINGNKGTVQEKVMINK